MATSIANLNVKITGDARGFNAAAAGAMKSMKAINAQARAVTGLTSAFKTVAAQQTMLGKATMAGSIIGVKGLKAFNGAMDGVIKSARFAGGVIKSAFTVGIAAIAAATAAASKFFMAGFKDIDAVSDMAKRLDVSTEALSRLQYAARQSDVEVEALNNGIGKMLVNIQKAAGGSREASKALADIGLTAAELKSMSPDAAFAAIAEGIKGLKSPYEQAAAAQQIFGKGGLQLLPMLREGSSGLNAMADDARRLGVEVTAIEAGRIDALDGAAKEARAGITGLAQSVAAELSPYVTELTARFTAFITEAGGLQSYVAPALDILLKGVGYLADGFYAIKSVVAFVRSGITKLAEVAVMAFGQMLKDINNFTGALNQLAEWAGLDIKIGKIDTTEIDNLKDALGQVSSDYLDEGLANMDKAIGGEGSKAVDDWRKGIENAQRQADAKILGGQAVGSWFGSSATPTMPEDGFDDAAKDADKFGDAMAAVKSEIDAINQTPIDIKIADLTRDFPELAADQIEEYRKALENLDVQKLGASLKEQLVTPMDEAQRQFDDIQKAFEAGAITADEQKQLLENLKGGMGEVDEGFTGPSDQFASAARVGSAESDRLDAMFANQQSRASSGTKDKSEKQLKESEKQSRLLASINSSLTGGIVQVTEVTI